MKLFAAVLLAAQAATHSAFTILKSPSYHSACASAPSALFSVEQGKITETAAAKSTPCDIPEDVKPTSLMDQPNGGRILRSSVVTDANGDFTQLGRAMGKGTSVVVFLRHMG